MCRKKPRGLRVVVEFQAFSRERTAAESKHYLFQQSAVRCEQRDNVRRSNRTILVADNFRGKKAARQQTNSRTGVRRRA